MSRLPINFKKYYENANYINDGIVILIDNNPINHTYVKRILDEIELDQFRPFLYDLDTKEGIYYGSLI